MEIDALKGLEYVVPVLESELGKDLKERKDLGLSVPENFNVQARLYSSSGVLAESISKNPPSIVVNVAQNVYRNLNKKNRKELSSVMEYFDITKDFFMGGKEETVLSTMEDPEGTLSIFEDLMSKEDFEKYKDIFREKGTSYEEHKEMVIEKSGDTRKKLRRLWPKIISKFEDSDFSFLRHELDHIDFFSSPVYRNHMEKGENIEYLEKNIVDRDSFKKYAQTNFEFLDSMSKTLPLLESRALFFGGVPRGEWGNVNFDEVKEDVIDYFSRNYTGNISERIISKLIPYEWSEGRIDKNTAHYLLKKVEDDAGNNNPLNYRVDYNEVNKEAADRILYEDIPEYKKMFSDNMEKATDIIGDAYRDNPRRLREANKAENFDEYLEICRR